ncbi:RxLR effector protein, partial [Phytophthora megakarya]
MFYEENIYYQTTLISTLTRSYGDEALFEQYHLWLANGRSPDNIFTLLKLDQAGYKVPNTESIATKLKVEQVNRWLELNKTPEDILWT